MIHNPPADMLAPEGAGIVFAILCLVTFALFALVSIHRSLRTRNAIPLALMAGGLATMSVEPMLEYLGLLWMPNNLSYVIWRAFDRNMSAWMLLGYGFYFGGLSSIVYIGLMAGRRKGYLWCVYIIGWVLDAFFETTGDMFGLYKYYGPQPFNLWGVPLWWEFINAASPIIVGVLCFLLKDSLKAWKVIFVVVLGPCAFSGLHGFTSWPVFTALHSDVGSGIINFAALVTCTIGLAGVAFFISFVDDHRASCFRMLFE
jgi:hypothetical protein